MKEFLIRKFASRKFVGATLTGLGILILALVAGPLDMPEGIHSTATYGLLGVLTAYAGSNTASDFANRRKDSEGE